MISLLHEQLERISGRFPGAALASSLSAEDLVLTDAIASVGLRSRSSSWTPVGCMPIRSP
jgi:hypothetical protein